MTTQYILDEKNRKNGWTNEVAAAMADIDFERYKDLYSGTSRPSYEEALKLADLYKIPAPVFLSEDTFATHINSAAGTYSNSNHGYIQIVNNNTDAGLKDLIKELITILKPDIVWPKDTTKE